MSLVFKRLQAILNVTVAIFFVLLKRKWSSPDFEWFNTRLRPKKESCLDYKCIQNLDIRFSDPHCIAMFAMLDVPKLERFTGKIDLFYLWAKQSYSRASFYCNKRWCICKMVFVVRVRNKKMPYNICCIGWEQTSKRKTFLAELHKKKHKNYHKKRHQKSFLRPVKKDVKCEKSKGGSVLKWTSKFHLVYRHICVWFRNGL
jgi:hypothetical protein